MADIVDLSVRREQKLNAPITKRDVELANVYAVSFIADLDLLAHAIATEKDPEIRDTMQAVYNYRTDAPPTPATVAALQMRPITKDEPSNDEITE